jgi:hypothetical protein
MDDDQTGGLDPQRLTRIAGQTDKMEAAGRLTAEEAEWLRAAADVAGGEKVVRDIRVRHASERLDVAVAEGQISRQEADDILDRLRGGEHSRQLRTHLARLRVGRRRRRPADPEVDTYAGKERPA